MAKNTRRKGLRLPKSITLNFDTQNPIPYQLPDALPGDTIIFSESKNRAFRVVFQQPEGSPLDREISDKNTRAQVIVSPMCPTTYRYAFAIFDAKKKELFLEAHCPSIIVN